MDLYRRMFEDMPDALLLVDARGRITRANEQAVRFFGYPHGELVGLGVDRLVPEGATARHAAHRERFAGDSRMRRMGAGLELAARRRDGTEVPVDIMLSPVQADGETLTLCVVRDISDRKRAESLQVSLREKEVLLQEIHHRVKNNLGVISSLFYLQGRHTQDPGLQRILRDSQGRVHSLALVHETLYRSEDFSAVDFARYAAVLADRIVAAFAPDPSQVTLSRALDPILIPMDRAVPCGLILNELLTNALVHGLRGGRGTIALALRGSAEGWVTLRVQDDGAGLPPGFPEAGTGSLGLRIVRTLAQQIGGACALTPAPAGTLATLTFPLEKRHD